MKYQPPSARRAVSCHRVTMRHGEKHLDCSYSGSTMPEGMVKEKHGLKQISPKPFTSFADDSCDITNLLSGYETHKQLRPDRGPSF